VSQQTSSEKVSLSRKSLKSSSLPKTGWLAIFVIHFSKANRRCFTKVSSNLPMAFLSGTGGTTTPGLLFDKVSYSQRKSEYRRKTEKADFWNAVEVVRV